MEIETWFGDRIHDDGVLVEFEIEVARRADDLARQCREPRDRDTDRMLWVSAEQEVCALVGETRTR